MTRNAVSSCPDVVQGADVRVIQRGDGSRLALEALLQVRRISQMGWQHLDRDHAIQSGVPGPIDLAHASSADGAEDVV
jgi:hypothetical protein